MSRALVTFATGEFEPLVDLSFPGFNEYATRHGYELRTDPPAVLMRPPSWGKIRVMLDALAVHDEVLWVDADVAMLDTTIDLTEFVPDDAWQAMTRHHTVEGEVPSCGVWYVRLPMREQLERAWHMTMYMNHRWWEQAAIQDMLGYTPNELPVRLDEPTALYDRTHWLDAHEWNALASAGTNADGVRFAHCGAGQGLASRAQIMRSLIERSSSVEVSA